MTTRIVAWIRKTVLALLGITLSMFVIAQDPIPEEEPEYGPEFIEHAMTAARLGQLIVNVDENAELNGTSWFFEVAGLETIVVYDVAADRMRIVIRIGAIDELDKEELIRMMQANFDSALDARYAIAQGMLWGTFIHPLSTLTDEEFLAGLGQTANVVMSYGSTYSSGLFIFGSGDSAEIERQRLIEELKNTQT